MQNRTRSPRLLDPSWKAWIVIHDDPDYPGDPQVFTCRTDTKEHAVSRFRRGFPRCTLRSVVEGEDFVAALRAYKLSTAGKAKTTATEPWIVLYQTPSNPFETLGFQCQAESMDDADQQCETAHPGCNIPWAEPGTSREEAIEHWNASMVDYFAEAEEGPS